MKSQKIKRTIIFIIVAILVMLVGTVWFSLYTIDRIKSNLEFQVRTRTVIITLKENLACVLNAETSERGFLLSGDTAFLGAFEQALADINSNVSRLRSLIRDDPDQQNNLGLLQDVIYAKISSARTLIELRKSQLKNNSASKTISLDKDKYYIDTIRKLNHKMQKKEEGLFDDRKSNTSNSIQRANFVFIIEGLLALLSIIFLAVIIVNELNRRTRVEKKLKRYNIDLTNKNKEIEQFAYVASHDLQEPLRSISNFTRLLSGKLKDNSDKEIREYISFVSGAATRMSSLIFDLLEYSRIGKDRNKYPINCTKLVNEVLEDMSAAIEESEAEIHIQTLPVVNGFVYMKSLFQNLISNSIKFHRENVKPVIYINASENENDFVFTVKDNGIGIEKEYSDKIFIIFQRLHPRSEFPGTGIGLAQCKKIVELHGGRIYVESEPGKGSSFIFTIPKDH